MENKNILPDEDNKNNSSEPTSTIKKEVNDDIQNLLNNAKKLTSYKINEQNDDSQSINTVDTSVDNNLSTSDISYTKQKEALSRQNQEKSSVEKPGLLDITKAMARSTLISYNLAEYLATPTSDSRNTFVDYYSTGSKVGVNAIKLLRDEDISQTEFKVQQQDLLDYNKKYWLELVSSESAEELEYNKEKIARQQADDEIIANSPWYKTLPIGAGLFITEAIVTSGASLAMFPSIPKAALYSSKFNGLFKNAVKVLPKMVAGSAAYNIPAYLNKIGKKFDEYALESFVEGVFGSALHGVFGLSKTVAFNKHKAIMTGIYKDLDFIPVVDKKGRILKVKVVPNGSTIKGSFTEDIPNSAVAHAKKEMGIKNLANLKESDLPKFEQLVNDALSSNKQSQNIPTSEIVKMKAKDLENFINTGIDDYRWFVKGQKNIQKFNTGKYAAQQASASSSANAQSIVQNTTAPANAQSIAQNTTAQVAGSQNPTNLKTSPAISGTTTAQPVGKIMPVRNMFEKNTLDENVNGSMLNKFLHWGPLGKLLEVSPVVKIAHSPFKVVRESLGQLYNNVVIPGKLISKEHADLNAAISNIKFQLKDKISKQHKQNLKTQLKSLNAARKAAVDNSDKDLITYSGAPPSDYSVQAEINNWMNKFELALINTRQEWLDYTDTGPITAHAPFVEQWKAAGDFLGRMKNDPLRVYENFLEEVSVAIQDEGHPVKQVMNSANNFVNLLDNCLEELQNLGFLSHINKETRGYLHRMPNQKVIRANYFEFVDVLTNALKARDAKNKSLLAPQAPFKKEIAKLKWEIEDINNKLKAQNLSAQDISMLNNQKNTLEQQMVLQSQGLKAEQSNLQKMIDDGTIPITASEKLAGLTQDSLLDQRVAISADLKQKYDILSRPLKNIKNKIERAILDQNEGLKVKLIEKEKRVNDFIDKQIKSGMVDQKLLFTDSKGITKLKDLEKAHISSLAKPKKNYRFKAKNIVNTYLGMSTEDLSEMLFDNLLDTGVPAKPGALKNRTVLFGDNILRPYMEKNIARVMESHVRQLGKFIAMNKFFKQYGANMHTGKDAIINNLYNEADLKREVISRILDPVRKEKLLAKLDNQTRDARTLIEESLQVIQNDYGKPRTGGERMISGFARFMKVWAYSTQMGGVALMASGDAVAPIIRHGFGHLKTIAPMIKQMVNLKADRYLYADMGIGCETFRNSLREPVLFGNDYIPGAFSQSMLAKFRGTDALPGSVGSRFLANLSKVASNSFLISPAFDACEVMATKTFEATIARLSNKWFSKGYYEIVANKSGKKTKQWVSEALFTQQELEYFRASRFNVKAFGKRIQIMIDKYGEPKNGSIIPHTEKWTDIAAAEHYRKFARSMADSLLNKAGPGDVPYWAKNPILSMFMQFTSWGFAASNNYFAPLVQRPDLKKLQWAGVSILAGMTVGPFRNFFEGRETNWDFTEMFWAGVAESGILPWYVRQFARFNSAFNIPYAKDFKSSRYRNKAGTEILLGPPGNLIDASVQLTNKFLKGEIDKKAFFRLRRLLPLSWAFYLRPFFTDIKQQEIKRKKKEMNEKVNKATRKTKKNKNTDELNF